MTGAADWDGAVGTVWASEWRRTDRSFAELQPHLHAALLAALPPRPARVVEIGSGAGTPACALSVSRPDDAITGIDISVALVAVAQARSGNCHRLDFRHGDAADLIAGFAPIDLIYSRHGVMFFADPIAAFAAMRYASAPAGRLVFTCFADRADNPWASETVRAIGGDPAGTPGPGPFAFADPAHVAAILAAAGWRATAPVRIAFRFVIGAGDDPVADALAYLQRIGPAASALRDLDAVCRPVALAALAALCERHCRDGQVAFPAAAWLWSVSVREGLA